LLRVIGKGVDLDAVTQAIGWEPTISIRVGEILPPGTRPRTEGIWAYSTENNVASSNLSDHLQTLVERLAPDVRERLPKGCRLEIQCVWRSATGHGGPMLPASLLHTLGTGSIDLDFDIYFDD
jgi:hypothetical protein